MRRRKKKLNRSVHSCKKSWKRPFLGKSVGAVGGFSRVPAKGSEETMNPADQALTAPKIPAPKIPAKKQAVITAALRLFLEQGFGATSMDAIAREAGVSKATLYAHVKNKEELFAHIVTSCAAQLVALHPGFENQASDVRAELLAFARDHLA